MATIFVSYRHEDGAWAGRIHDELEERYDVYFDTERPPGEVWREELEAAFDDCRVLVAVIGKGWKSKRNVHRLRNENDLVRGELLRALGRKAMHVIPVLTRDAGEDDAAKPRKDAEKSWQRSLPDELKPLLDRQWITISHYEFKRDVKALLAAIEGHVAGHRTLQKGRIPAVLPHLCDRLPPQTRFMDFAPAAARSAGKLMVVVRGHKSESHGGFLDRLLTLGKVDEALRAQEGIAVHNLWWDRQHATQGGYRQELSRRIKEAGLGRELLSDDELVRWLARPGQARLFVLQLTWTDHLECGEGLLPGIAAAWRELFEIRGADGKVESVVPRHPLVLWVNFSYDEPSQASAAAKLGVGEGTLDLGAVVEDDVRGWLERRDVKPYAISHEAELRRLVSDPTCCFEPGKLHMEVFADKVREILERA